MIMLFGFGKIFFKKFCGKFNNGLFCFLLRIRRICGDERICIEVDVDNNEIRLFFLLNDMEKVVNYMKNVLDCERRWL